MPMWQSSRRHLAEAGETYAGHFRFALTVGLMTLGAGLACIIHALVPGLCQRTCSRTVAQLQSLFAARERRQETQREASGVLTFVALIMLAATITLLLLAAGAPPLLLLSIGSLAFCFAAAFLLTNSELEPVSD
jgi:hypothetical protein